MAGNDWKGLAENAGRRGKRGRDRGLFPVEETGHPCSLFRNSMFISNF
jgi:hypothetical protein